jgi:hypothetical protein
MVWSAIYKPVDHGCRVPFINPWITVWSAIYKPLDHGVERDGFMNGTPTPSRNLK